jgi:GT2 family glycosyltransferase
MQDPRVRIIRHEVNRGLGAARNTGFAAATAPLVLPLDGDDLLTPDCLAKLLAVLGREPEADCVYPDYELFGAESGVRAHRLETIGAMTTYQWVPGAGVLMKRALWERAGHYDESPVLRLGNEDWDFWLRVAEKGFLAAHLVEPLYLYRQHAANMSHGLRAQDHVTRRYLLRHHAAFYREHGGGRKFLATGYWHASDVARRRGHPFSAFALGLRAVWLDGDWARARNQFSLLLPESLLTRFRRLTA